MPSAELHCLVAEKKIFVRPHRIPTKVVNLHRVVDSVESLAYGAVRD